MKKVTKSWFYSFAIMGVFLMVTSSCKKKDDTSNPTPATGTVTDIDGNVYHIVTIGTQAWVVENLKTTRYNDGTSIPLVTDDDAWASLTTPGYCWYNNDASMFKNTYGALYNWYTVNTGKLAPPGWHVPTDAEWTTLITYLGGVDAAGAKLKSTGTIPAGTGLWRSPNYATNESGFTAVPAGTCDYDGLFSQLSSSGYWWSASENDAPNAWFWYMFYDHSYTGSNYGYKTLGFSVRCIRDF
jgi:uncharacterized protein (TIGR02145 family)